ncbi:MAG: penicillin-binding transpeptidase domain-containing protein [Oscillospiraceae bacterium]|nr:penicillin-binding transpeptidase domain-containing protein [Oscillospiraceae bacterium]
MAKKQQKNKNGFPFPERDRANRPLLSRTFILLVVCGVLVFIPLVFTLYKLMVSQHDYFEGLAISNQTRSTEVTASRGTIYDRNMNVLSTSATVENIFIDPNGIEANKQDLDLIASGLSEILGVQESFVKEQAADTTKYYKIIKKKVTEEVADQVRTFINDNDIIGIYLEPDSQRYYPYSSLAAQVLGFVNADNVGSEGIEAYYNSVLEGTSGEIIRTKGAGNSEMLYSYEKFYDATDGNSLVLTVDSTVQYYLEKNMEAAVEKYNVQKGAFGIVMNVNTGEIVAMATLGGYDPNSYLEIYDTSELAELNTLKEEYEKYTEGTTEYETAYKAYTDALVAARQSQWRNRCTSDGYEPGSTFKLITLSSALEEGTTTLSDTFYCGGTVSIKGRTSLLNCWKAGGHGSETTAQALQNSCNIAFAQIGINLGGEKFYEYVKNFGLMEKTGIDLYGEGSGYFFQKDLLTDPDSYASLTSGAFGQTFKVTPLQLVRAISAVVNGGYVLKPYLVSEVLDADGNTISKTEPTVLRQVISEETSKTMCELMESVVTVGTAKNARLIGYRIGGKTGTSEKIDEFDENGELVKDRIVSFVGVAPIDDPQYIVLVALDTPDTTEYYVSGGVMAAPTVRDVLSDILPYLGIEPDYTDAEIGSVNVEVPDVAGMTESEASAALSEKSLTYEVRGTGTTVTGQIPATGSEIPGASKIILYMGEEKPTDQIEVPSLQFYTVTQADNYLNSLGLYLQTKGAPKTESADVVITDQDIEAGTKVDRGTTVTVELTDQSVLD